MLFPGRAAGAYETVSGMSMSTELGLAMFVFPSGSPWSQMARPNALATAVATFTSAGFA